jgi:hypothetical protein
MSGDVGRRLAANEGLFRKVNEGIARGQWPGDPGSSIGFRCECARLGCNVLIGMTLADYEKVRSSPRRFVVLDGHEMAQVERVVERREHYVVVEKVQAAGEEAARRDPRG